MPIDEAVEHLQIRAERGGPGQWTVHLTGELDLATAELFSAFVANEPSGTALRVDLAELSFMDCAGLHAIETAKRSLAGRLVLVHAGRCVRRLLELTKTEHALLAC